jgi:dolichol-phosphate mannosyltransferase
VNGGPVFFSIIIPAHNEEESIGRTVRAIAAHLDAEQLTDYEILVVNDNSRDGTEAVLRDLAADLPRLRHVNNEPPNGFGFAVRCGLAHYRGDCACIVMGDLSDAPEDIAAYYRAMQGGAECVFGSRFIAGSRVVDYPRHKLWINRLANRFIKLLFRLDTNDITNAFKCYHRRVIDGIQPLLSAHFNLTVEMPLKTIVRGYRYTVIPISWTNRAAGESKLKIKEMGSRYLFIVLYVWLERTLSRGDYVRRQPLPPPGPRDGRG